MALVVVTGGARSGKSGVAQRLAAQRHGRVTVAVFGSAEGDDEMARRIERHRADRSPQWRVLDADASGGWVATVPPTDVLVVDCLGTLLGRIMIDVHQGKGLGSLRRTARLPAWFEEAVEARLTEIVEALARRDGDTVVVTNEVGDGVVPAYATGRVFRDVLGRANRALVDIADAAYLVVAGRCIDLASLPQDIDWPGTDSSSKETA